MTPLFFAGDEEMDEQFFPVLISVSLDFECWICVSSHLSQGCRRGTARAVDVPCVLKFLGFRV